MGEYKIWEQGLFEYMDSLNVIYGRCGDTITVLNDSGHKIGDMHLPSAWLNKLSYEEIVSVLTTEA